MKKRFKVGEIIERTKLIGAWNTKSKGAVQVRVLGYDGYEIRVANIETGNEIGSGMGWDEDLFTPVDVLWYKDVKVGDLVILKRLGREHRGYIGMSNTSGIGLMTYDTVAHFNLKSLSMGRDFQKGYTKLIKIVRPKGWFDTSDFINGKSFSSLEVVWEYPVKALEVTMADLEKKYGCKVKVVK